MKSHIISCATYRWPYGHGTLVRVILCWLRPCLIRQKPDLGFKIRSWNHDVVNKQHVESEPGVLKTNAKYGSSFYSDVAIYNFIRTKFIKMSSYCFVKFLLWNCGLRIAKINCLKFRLTLAHRCPPSWIKWIRLRGWFHGFTNPDSNSENLA